MSESDFPIEHIARLARIQLTEQEKATFGKQLKEIVKFFDALEAVDTEGVEPTTHVLPVNNVLRRDEEAPSFSRSDVLANAPLVDENMLRIPPVFE